MKLERFKLKYVPQVVSWVDDEVQMVQWAGGAFRWPITQKQFREHLRVSRAKPPALYPFALIDRGAILGYCELAQYNPRWGLAILSRVLISPRRRHAGLGRLMVSRAVRFGFEELGLHRIGLSVFDFNRAAIRCYSSLDFVLEGTQRHCAKVDDSYWNCHLMSLLRTEWKG